MAVYSMVTVSPGFGSCSGSTSRMTILCPWSLSTIANTESGWTANSRHPDRGGGDDDRLGSQTAHLPARTVTVAVAPLPPRFWARAELGVVDLVVGLASQLTDELVNLGQAGGSNRMAAGKQPAARIDCYLGTVDSGRPRQDRFPSFASRKHTEVFTVDELGNCEAVVQLDDVEVRGRDPCAGIGPLGGAGRSKESGQVLAAAQSGDRA